VELHASFPITSEMRDVEVLIIIARPICTIGEQANTKYLLSLFKMKSGMEPAVVIIIAMNIGMNLFLILFSILL
jgi:hypothetical protein